MLEECQIDYRFYADDLVLIGSIDELRKTLTKIDKWNGDNNMLINKSKSGWLPLFGTKQENDVIDGIPVVTEYKYLGMMINSNL